MNDHAMTRAAELFNARQRERLLAMAAEYRRQAAEESARKKWLWFGRAADPMVVATLIEAAKGLERRAGMVPS